MLGAENCQALQGNWLSGMPQPAPGSKRRYTTTYLHLRASPLVAHGPWEVSPSHILYPSTTFRSTLDHFLPASLPQNHSMCPLKFSWPSSVKAGYSTCNELSYPDGTCPSTLQNSGQTSATLRGLSLPSEGRCPLFCLHSTILCPPLSGCS